ncbi:C2H2 finger domain-containing protein [Paraphaeosphaeria sporulosa]
MAEIAGFLASIAQVASSGMQLSSAMYESASGAARAEQEVADIADHVKTTAIALDGVARIVAQEDGIHDVTNTALSEAGDLAKRCEAVFGDVQDLIAKRKNPDQDESKASRMHEQSKEQKTELLRRRLDSLKHSILLLLHVLQLANAQAKGSIDNSLIAQERDAIRELHQRQQDALRALQALESNLGDVFFSDDETLNGSAAPSRVPTINFLVHSSARGVSSDGKNSGPDRSREQAPSALGDKPETSDSDNSDETVTDDDEDLTINELARCVNRAQKFSKRITALQQAGNAHSNGRFPRNRVLKLYRRFCRKFEVAMSAHESATPTVAPLKPVQYTHQHGQLVQPDEAARDPLPPTQQTPVTLPDPSAMAANRVVHSQSYSQPHQNSTRTAGPAVEVQHAPAAPAWTISSEPLGPGRRPQLPPLISPVSTVPRASRASPTNDTMSPIDDHDARYSGTDGDGDHGSHEHGPVVYTKTGRISKAKKGLKVHVCEECGRSFTRAEHLRRHQKNHGPNQVRCELCGKVFFRADLLQRHLERHKDLPHQTYRSTFASNTESASPVADNQHHRHILPTPETVRHVIPSQHSPGGRSVNSSGASGAPTPLEASATASSTVFPRPHSTWETGKPQTAISQAPEDVASQRTHAWQTVNAQERRQLENTTAHASSPSIQQSHPGLPKLQPRADTANGASAQKRYSNILPAPGAASSQHQNANYPQEHMPNMVPPVQAAVKAVASPAVQHELHQSAHRPHSPVVSTGSGSAVTSYSDQSHVSRSLPASTPGHAANHNIESGKVSSDKEGVNWRLAETDAQPYRKRKHHRTVSQTDGESSGIDDRGSGPVAHRTPDLLDRSRSGSRSLSLVTPQDDRDHALLGASRTETRQVVSPRGVQSATALSPSLAQRRSTSRPSTGVSEPANAPAGKATSGPESPEPESPYSLATINRYIQNQGPQPGAQDDTTEAVSPHISLSPCERCREYSIRCDGKLPSCTACATTKYAGECSFASMSAHPAHLVSANTGPPGPKFYENMSAMTRHAMAEPPSQLIQPVVASNQPRVQEYNSEEDLPSPYLKARDKGQSTAHIPRTSLDADAEAQTSRKRKAGAQNDAGEGGAAHERKRSKGESVEGAKGKDIVDLLLKEWTVPVS